MNIEPSSLSVSAARQASLPTGGISEFRPPVDHQTNGGLTPEAVVAPFEADTSGVRTARLPGPAEGPLSGPSVPEFDQSFQRHGPSLSRRLVDHLDALRQSETKIGSEKIGASKADHNVMLRRPSAEPGPATLHLRPPPVEGQNVPRDFDDKTSGNLTVMLNNLREISAYSVQVSLTTKTTGSFTGSLNKLLSSG